MLVRKILALAVALALCLGTLSLAQAETEYPPRPQGTVADLAGVLGEKTITDMEALSQRLEDETKGHIYVLTRHFLGGMNVQAYADKVFEVWELTGQDALLLMVIGEESYALSLGGKAKAGMPAESQTSLLATHFRSAFLSRQYDEALSDLAVNLGQAMAKAQGAALNASGLFGQAAIQSTPQPQSVSDYWYGMFARDDYDAREDNDEAFWRTWQDEWEYEETRINWRSLIIWALVIYFLFFRRKKSRRRR